MNQILTTKLKSKYTKKKSWFQFQFTFSILILFLSAISGFSYFYYLQRKEKLANDLLSNYHIYQLYQDQSFHPNNLTEQSNNNLFRYY